MGPFRNIKFPTFLHVSFHSLYLLKQYFVFSRISRFFILCIDVSQVGGDKMLSYIVCWIFYIILWNVAIPMYHTTESIAFADVPDDPLHDLFVFLRIVVERLVGCTVRSQVQPVPLSSKLHLVCYQRCVSYPVNGYCVWYEIFVDCKCALLYVHNGEWLCRFRLKFVIRFLRLRFSL